MRAQSEASGRTRQAAGRATTRRRVSRVHPAWKTTRSQRVARPVTATRRRTARPSPSSTSTMHREERGVREEAAGRRADTVRQHPRPPAPTEPSVIDVRRPGPRAQRAPAIPPAPSIARASTAAARPRPRPAVRGRTGRGACRGCPGRRPAAKRSSCRLPIHGAMMRRCDPTDAVLSERHGTSKQPQGKFLAPSLDCSARRQVASLRMRPGSAPCVCARRRLASWRAPSARAGTLAG